MRGKGGDVVGHAFVLKVGERSFVHRSLEFASPVIMAVVCVTIPSRRDNYVIKITSWNL